MKCLFYAMPIVAAGSFMVDGGLWGPIILLMGLIAFHEAGHFLVAKWIGMPVSVYSLGFGPRLFGFRWNETDVRLSLLPFGGYVRLSEEFLQESGAIDVGAFCKDKSILAPLLFYAGGVIANVFITVVILFCLGVSHSRVINKRLIPSPLIIAEVSTEIAAARVGLRPMDRIHKLDNLTFPQNNAGDIIAYIHEHPGKTVSITIERDGVKKDIKTVLQNSANKGSLGIVFEDNKWIYERRELKFKDLRNGVSFALTISAKLGLDIIGGLGNLISHRVSLNDVSGPIAIIRASSRAARAGLTQFLMLSAIISMNLAVINVLPIPFLDGGHIAILLYERLYRKAIPEPIKRRLFTGGFLLLVSLTLVIIAMDIIKIFK